MWLSSSSTQVPVDLDIEIKSQLGARDVNALGRTKLQAVKPVTCVFGDACPTAVLSSGQAARTEKGLVFERHPQVGTVDR